MKRFQAREIKRSLSKLADYSQACCASKSCNTFKLIGY